MSVADSQGFVTAAMVISGKGKGDKHGALREKEKASRPSSPPMLMARIRGPLPSTWNEDQVTRNTPCGCREGKARKQRAQGRKCSSDTVVRIGRRTRGGSRCRRRCRGRRGHRGGGQRRRCTSKLVKVRV
eukprot:4875083-Pleurochrysis_carterae.AAC.2